MDLSVPVFDSLNNITNDIHFDTIIACGPPYLHDIAIQYAILNNVKCFVEKPHLLEYTKMVYPQNLMIGYNFNFLPFLNDMQNITNIDVGTNGLYANWGDIFDKNITEYMYAIHSILVHPLSVLVHKYNKPTNVDIIAHNNNNNVDMIIELYYNEIKRTITYSTNCKEFFMNIIADGKTIETKPYKSNTYYDMFKYFFTTNDIKINNFNMGNIVLNIINDCKIKLIKC